MYKLLENLEVELRPVSPRSLKLYRKMILDEAQKQKVREDKDEIVSISEALEATAYTLEIFVEKDQTLEWAKAIFKMTDQQYAQFEAEWEDYNYEEFVRGFQDFLSKVSPMSKK